jgi:GDSL-like Lipase/Acylhydrolase family
MTRRNVSEYNDSRMIKDSSSNAIQRVLRFAMAIAAIAVLSIAFYASPAPEQDLPLLSPMQALSPTAAPGGGLPITDAQGLANKMVYHLETRSFEVPGAYSLVFLPKRAKSVSLTVAMKGVFKIGLDSNSKPRIVAYNVGDTPSPQPALLEISSDRPLAIPDGAVAVTFPDTRALNPATGTKPHAASGSVEIQIGPSKTYQFYLPLKSITQIYIGVRQIPPTFSKMLLIRRDETPMESSVFIPENGAAKIPLAMRIIAFIIAIVLVLRGPQVATVSARLAIFVGIIQGVLGIVIFNLPGMLAKPSGAISILCALTILAQGLLKNPAPVFGIIAFAATILFLFPVWPVIPATVCLAALFLTAAHALRHRKLLNRAQFLLPLLFIALLPGFEFKHETRGQSGNRGLPMTGSRLDTWAIYRHTDIMDNHKELRGEEFRGAFVHCQKPEDVFRIIALGSSSTYGAGIGDPKQTWPAQLENLLRDDCRSNVEVVNAGWGGYNAFQLAVWLKEVLWRYNPDAVILYYGGNEDGDSRPENYYWRIRRELDRLGEPNEKEIRQVLRYGVGRSPAIVFLDQFSGMATYAFLRNLLIRPQAPVMDEQLPPPTITRSLKIMLDVARAYDFQLVLVPEIEAQGGNQPVKTLKPRITQEMKDFAEANHIEFSDLTGRWESVKNEPVSFDLVHLTPLGCGYLARFIADRLYDGPVLRGMCTRPLADAAPVAVVE